MEIQRKIKSILKNGVFMYCSNEAKFVCQKLHDAGHQAFLVGGCVRDSILGLEPKDWDIATDAHPDKVISLFQKVIPTGIEYGTVTIMENGEPIEVTTFRADGNYGDGRRPDAVKFSLSIEDDLARRDFSCNAIAWNPISEEMVDPYKGHLAIINRLITAVGNPVERFQEDGLRILRAIRFCAQKGFNIELSTLNAIRDNTQMLDNVSKERIREEMLKTVAGKNVGEALNILLSSGVLKKVCPELARQAGLSQNQYHAYDVWEHTVKCVESERTSSPILRLAVLLHDIAKPETRNPHPKNPGDFQFLGHEKLGAEMAEEWMRKNKFSNEEIQMVTHVIRYHLIYYTSEWSDKQLRKWLRRVGERYLTELLELRRADICGKGPDVSEYLEGHEELISRIETVNKEVPHSAKALAIGGKEIMSILGLSKGGPIVGEVMKTLMEAVTEDPSRNTVKGLTEIAEGFRRGI